MIDYSCPFLLLNSVYVHNIPRRKKKERNKTKPLKQEEKICADRFQLDQGTQQES